MRIITEGIQEYIFDYATHCNNFKIWRILFGKCVYSLYNYENSLLNGYAAPIFTNIDDFDDSITLEEIPIEEWPFRGNNPAYVEYVELLYSYHDTEYTNHNINPLDEEYEETDDEEEIDFKITFNKLATYLYNKLCLSNKVYNQIKQYIHRTNYDISILRYNTLCYILIQKYISEMNNEYNVLYDNFYNTWKSLNDISLLHTPEQYYHYMIVKLQMMNSSTCLKILIT